MCRRRGDTAVASHGFEQCSCTATLAVLRSGSRGSRPPSSPWTSSELDARLPAALELPPRHPAPRPRKPSTSKPQATLDTAARSKSAASLFFGETVHEASFAPGTAVWPSRAIDAVDYRFLATRNRPASGASIAMKDRRERSAFAQARPVGAARSRIGHPSAPRSDTVQSILASHSSLPAGPEPTPTPMRWACRVSAS